MLRRHDKIYCYSGRDKYQEDEAMNGLYHILPRSLRNPESWKGACWSYGWKENIKEHHLTEKDFHQ